MLFKEKVILLDENNIDDFISKVKNINIEKPFSKNILEKIVLFSNKLLKGNYLPEFKYLAFFFRKANLENWKRRYYRKNLFPYGITFHIVPTNVPNIFLFSSFFSILTGNIAIVRISSKILHQLKFILEILKESDLLNKRLFIVSYPSEKENLTIKLSNISHVRFIWGGNETVEKIKKLSENSYLKDITFPDRYSVSFINVDYLFSLKKEIQKRFFENFIKDIITFYQLACSSPRMVFLKGKEKTLKKFIKELLKFNLNLPEEIINKKLKNIMILSTSSNIEKIYKNTLQNLVLLKIKKKCDLFYKNLFIGGILLFKKVKSIKEIEEYIPKNIQTFTHFSKRKPNISKFNIKPLRIVKVGEALNFCHIWDGYNIILENLKTIVY